MIRRFSLYLVGVGLGVLLVMIFFKDRLDVLSSWLPEPRIRTEVIEKFDKTSLEKCAPGLNYQDWLQFLNQADIDFSKLVKTDTSRIYELKVNSEIKKVEISEKHARILCP